jgi:hypothetical protein
MVFPLFDIADFQLPIADLVWANESVKIWQSAIGN